MLNLIHILMSFQAVSGLNIKLAKSKLVRLGECDGRMLLLWRAIGCKSVELPIKYLGLPSGVEYKDVMTQYPVVA